ncbi:DUF4279 domain-containing protein [Paenibacillus cucumis (ex Kampfer et al. 2016)]|uniref:DUF4279 domain-containing protein n=1 Tax=Paenibacillus cucumis (ex Kampfer et al. 2016) TaxID=1776858 RepID=A0ABS7KKG5_9BACL|nr:DUF4279 domain-containing protein [Paenibacillus cucumis (ex Kampfer et al. 2016)]MBY0204432.1 DUF4279 domain-containing protein [Paenibacillus cucumis (ex Kampfer et al. 2016)]
MKGKFTFVIRDEVLDFADISERLRMKPALITRRGHPISKRTKLQAPYDIWSFDVLITKGTEPEEALNNLLNKLTPNCKQMNSFIKQYKEVKISGYLRSDYGQMGLEISHATMKKMVGLGLGLEIHILSYGGVITGDE